MNFRFFARITVFLLVFFLPFGTRLIFRSGEIDGAAVEWGTVSLYGTQVLVPLFFVLAAISSGRQSIRRVIVHPASILIIVLAGLSSVSAALTVTGQVGPSFIAVSWVILGWMIIVSILALRPPSRIIYWGILLSAAIQAVLAIGQFLTQSVFSFKWLGMAAHRASDLGAYVAETGDGRWLRAYGSFGHPNILGFFLVLGIVSAAALLSDGSGRRTRIAVWPILAVIGAALIFTLSKSALIAGAVALAVCLVFAFGKKNRESVRVIGTVSLLVFLGMAAVFPFAKDPVLSRIAVANRLETNSVSERMDLISDAVTVFRHRPFFGVGPGQMPLAVHQGTADSRSPWGYQPVHNVPLLVLTETGAVGLAAWLVLFGFLLISAIRNFKSPHQSFFLAFLSAVLVVSIFDHFLWSLWPGQLMVWLVMALILVPADRPFRIPLRSPKVR
ncbi:O-antigen ligase family protein [Candidatus Uhrbacteria bacterium]|nr:O-antigen ligase family protein [Candidatus Uhrbacteria bacterium]